MTTINQLSSVPSVTDGDQFVLWVTSQGDSRRVPASVVKAFMQAGLEDSLLAQYALPTATGFSVNITDGPDSVWLRLTPTGSFAAGTIVLPATANCVENQEVLVTCTQAVSSLTVSGNGSSVIGAPASLSANGFFKLKFDEATDSWYRVG